MERQLSMRENRALRSTIHIVLFVTLSLLWIGCAKDAEEETPSQPIAWPGVSTSPGSSNLTISGKAFYEDKPYDANGFTGAIVRKPIRRAVIKLIANDGLVPLASSQTAEDGSFSFSGINNSGRPGGVHLQIQAKNADDSASPAEIRNNKSANALLAVVGPTLDDSVNDNFIAQDIIVSTNTIGGAFNILDNFLKGGAFIQKSDFCPTNTLDTKCKAPFLMAYWQPGSDTGSFFEGGSAPAISIDGGGGFTNDPDEYDDTIVLHEYGHFITSTFSHDDSPGGRHVIPENTQDIRLSWSEGWATFFACAVLDSPIAVDTRSAGEFTFNIDIYNVDKSPQDTVIKFTTDEVANSGVLWDILDAPFPDDDPITTIGLLPIWQSFTEIRTTTDIATMEPFAVLFMRNNPAHISSFQTILTGRKIALFADSGESVEVSLTVNGPSQSHTLYTLNSADPFGDEDVIPFSTTAGTTYTVKTLNLANGADTFLTVKNTSGVVLFTNDNTDGTIYAVNCTPPSCPKNDSTTLSSSISFTPSIGGPLSVHVKRSPTAPLSTGKSGSYTIQITSP